MGRDDVHPPRGNAVDLADLADLALPNRAIAALERAGITTRERLASLSDLELAAVRGLGEGMLLAIRAVVPTPAPPTSKTGPVAQVRVDDEVRRAVARAVRARRGTAEERQARLGGRQRRAGSKPSPNLRGKKTVTAWLDPAVAETLETEWRAHRQAYARMRAFHDPSQVWALTKANAAAAIIEHGLDHPGEWLATVANDGRVDRDPVARVATERVGFLWPQDLLDRLEQAGQDLDREYEALMTAAHGRGRYRLTRGTMITAILAWGAPRLGECVLRAANDDRLSGLHPLDRRTKPDTWQRMAAVTSSEVL